MPEASGWAAEPERGSAFALRLALRIYRLLGRHLMTQLRWPVSLYFFLSSRVHRRASLQYLERVYASPRGRASLPRAPGNREVVRHLSEYGINLIDRMALWAGGSDPLAIRYDGDEHLRPLVENQTGGILLGAHLGSFDMLRALAIQYDFVVNVVMFTRHAPRINDFFEALDPASSMRILQVDPHSIRTAFDLRACIRRGELVAILADRIDPGSRARMEPVPFLGKPANFPLNPFLLATTINCPLLLALCVRDDNPGYRAVVRPLRESGAENVALRGRQGREFEAREALQRYVEELENLCYRHPYQWGNFYEFWTESHPDTTADRTEAE